MIFKVSLKMSISTTKKKKFCVIEVMADKRCVNKLYYITVLYYCGSSHWRCFGKKVLFENNCPEICRVELPVKVLTKYL